MTRNKKKQYDKLKKQRAKYEQMIEDCDLDTWTRKRFNYLNKKIEDLTEMMQ